MRSLSKSEESPFATTPNIQIESNDKPDNGYIAFESLPRERTNDIPKCDSDSSEKNSYQTHVRKQPDERRTEIHQYLARIFNHFYQIAFRVAAGNHEEIADRLSRHANL